MSRRFPPPWTAEPIAGGYKVVDATGFPIAYVYAGEERWAADRQLTPDEARRIARTIAKLPKLVVEQKEP